MFLHRTVRNHLATAAALKSPTRSQTRSKREFRNTTKPLDPVVPWSSAPSRQICDSAAHGESTCKRWRTSQFPTHCPGAWAKPMAAHKTSIGEVSPGLIDLKATIEAETVGNPQGKIIDSNTNPGGTVLVNWSERNIRLTLGQTNGVQNSICFEIMSGSDSAGHKLIPSPILGHGNTGARKSAVTCCDWAVFCSCFTGQLTLVTM